jgi:hypothetical protein
MNVKFLFMPHESSPLPDLHRRPFADHVETAPDLFWMRHNPLRDSLMLLERRVRSGEIVFRNSPSPDGEDEDEVTQGRRLDAGDMINLYKRLLDSVLRSCDAYLVSYYNHVLASQDGRTFENRLFIQEADESRRRSHVALTTSIRVLVRNLRIWGVDTQGMEAFVIEDDMDPRRREIGNFALHFAFSRYISP